MDDNTWPDGELFQPKGLADFCLRSLMKNYDALGDLGWHITPEQVRRIMHPCSRSHLEAIEDNTLEGSGRDVTWYTWHLWHKVFVQRYGAIRDDTELIPLPGEQPLDYEPPQGIKCPQADYRAMIMRREEAEEARKAAAVSKLRGSYQVEAKKRAMAGTDFTTRLPPPKRGRFSAAARQQKTHTAALNHKTIGGKPAVKVLQDLGIHRPKSAGRGITSNSSGIGVRKPPGSSSSSRPGYLAPNPLPDIQQQQSALAVLARNRPPATAAAGVRSSPKGGSSSNSIRSSSSNIVDSRTAAVPSRSHQQQQQQQQQRRRQQVISPQIRLAGSGAKRSGSSSSTGAGLGLLDIPVSLTASRSQHTAGGGAHHAAAAAGGGGGAGGTSAGLSRKTSSLGQHRPLGR